MTQEEVLLAFLGEETQLEPIEGTPWWRLGDVGVASEFPQLVTPTYGPAYGRRRWSVRSPAPSALSFPVIEVGENARVRFGWYLSPRAGQEGSDGAAFRIWCATEPEQRGECIFEATCAVDASRSTGMQRGEIHLPVDPGDSVRLRFETHPGPERRRRADRCYWEMPSVRWERRVKPKPSEGPNVVLFTLDTLRADRLSCYGNGRKTSPRIDALASQGALMTQAYAQSTTTIPSHISIMTSKYLKDFGIYGQSEDPLPENYRTLAESLKDAGYATAGFIAAKFMKDAWTGLGQGFDTFEECPVGTLDGEYIINSSIDWLVEHHGERFFMWIHLYDPHVPYDPPDPFKQRFVDRRAAYEPHLDRSLLPTSHDDMTFERLNGDYYSDRYDGAVAYTDHQVGRFASVLKSLGVGENTLIVVAADHGECLGEHSIYFAHVSLYEPNARVPLIFHWPGHVPEGKRFSQLCENVDVYPTILDLVGVEERGRLRGRSLAPVWRGDAAGREGVVTEHTEHLAVSWRTEEWTYFYQPAAEEEIRAAMGEGFFEGPAEQWVLHAGKEELYNRRADPDELHDQSTSQGDILNAMRADCAEWVRACDEAWEGRGLAPLSPVVDPERLENLRTFGYLQ